MLKEIARRTMPTEVFSALRSAKLFFSTRTFRPKLVRHTYGDSAFTVHICDATAELWYDDDWPLPSEIAELQRHGLGPGATVFNLGAHQGVVALMLADAVGTAGKVVAVEASPYNAQIAERNRVANGAENVHVVNAAAAAERGTLSFADSLCGHVDDGSGGIQVPARSIDDLAEEYGTPSILYIDIEGFECDALRGAGNTLAAGCDCYIEVHSGFGLEKYGGSVRELLSFFPADKYDLHFSEINDSGPFNLVASRDQISETQLNKRWSLIAVQKPDVN